MKRFNKLAIKIGILFIIITSLAVGIIVPASADTPPTTTQAAVRTLQGTVTNLASPNFTVQVGNQSQVIKTDSNTQFFLIPLGKAQITPSSLARDNKLEKREIKQENKDEKRANLPPQARAPQAKPAQIPDNWKNNLGWLEMFDKQAQFSDIAVGDRVIVRLQTADSLAKQVLIIKAPVNRSVKGTVSGVTANSVTITPNGGTPLVLNVVGETRIMLKGLTAIAAGQYAVAVYNSTNNNAVTINIQATAPVPAITINSIAVTPAPPANLKVGLTQQFTATASYSNGTTADITSQASWTSANTAVATISSGLATGVTAGSTNITASLLGKTGSVALTVVP